MGSGRGGEGKGTTHSSLRTARSCPPALARAQVSSRNQTWQRALRRPHACLLFASRTRPAPLLAPVAGSVSVASGAWLAVDQLAEGWEAWAAWLVVVCPTSAAWAA